QIEVGYLNGEAALAATLAAYREHSARPGCSTKATHRLPGWLRFPAAAAPLIQPLVEEINQHKLDFKALVQQAGGRDEKFELVHTAL
ncbi:DNA replication terminus site-binding protein, partial [Escherichia coli]|nr:DNA replication terminus site-binding protein [Escherichia coli]